MIKCTLGQPQFDWLYGSTKAAIKAELDNGKSFNVSSYMDFLYERIKKAEDADRAAQFLAVTPDILDLVISRNYADNIDNITGVEQLTKLRAKFSNPESNIDNVIEFFEKDNKVNLEINKQNKINTKGATVNKVDTKYKSGGPRLLANTILSATFPEYKSEGGKFDPETINPERNLINKTLSKIAESIDLQSSLLQFPEYQGKKIALRAVNMSSFTYGGTAEGRTNFSKLDSTTQDEIMRSRKLSSAAIAKSDVTQVNKRALIVVIDAETGKPLSFNFNGDIVDSKDINGKYVFQFMRDIQKVGNTYTVKDIYGIEDRVDTSNVDQKDLEDAYKLKQKALRGDGVVLNFLGMTEGVDSQLTKKEFSLKELMDQGQIKEKDLSTLKVLPKDSFGFKAGSTVIKINGTYYKLKGNRVTPVVDQIIDVLFSKKVGRKQKIEFYSQFIPENNKHRLTYTARRHVITPLKNGRIAIQIFDKVAKTEEGWPTVDGKTEGLTHTFFIAENGDVIDKTPMGEVVVTNPESVEELKNIFRDALNNAYAPPKGGASFMHYDTDLIERPNDFLEYRDGKFPSRNYIDFLMSQPSIVEIQASQKGFFNKQILFEESNKEVKKEDPNADLMGPKRTLSAEELALIDLSENLEKYRKLLPKQTTENYAVLSYILDQVTGNRYSEQLARDVFDLYNGPLQNTFTSAQVKEFNRKLNSLFPPITPEQNKKDIEDNQDDISGQTSLDLDLDRSGNLTSDTISKEDLKNANDFWKNSKLGKKLSKHIELNRAANIANSDAYAKFIIDGAQLLNPDVLGRIEINKAKGTLVDVYHEAFHGFTQLFLSKQEKIDLYNAVLNYKDKSGRKPYENMSELEVEEFLAEDFRTYMKGNYKRKSTLINRIFRRILNILKAIFGVKSKPVVSSLKVDAMAIPAVNELYTKLNFSEKYPGFLNKYKASIDNVMFYQLDRGVTAVDKLKNEKYRRTVLSKQDSDFMSSNIDSIISEEIDKFYDVRVGKSTNSELIAKYKGANISALLKPGNRAQIYKEVLKRLKDTLAELTDKHSTSENTISKIEDFEGIETAAVATLVVNEDDSTKDPNKYFFLSSQIDSFDNLTPNMKRGDRIKGETWQGVKIVGDYYVHNTIKDGSNRKAEIIVISELEDAEIQFDNYIKAGAKKYERVDVKEATEPELTIEDENVLNNMRLLETSIKNFGDPFYESKGGKPTGLIKYHLQNSDFEFGKVKYVVEEEVNEKGDELGESDSPVSEGLESMDPEYYDNKKSLYDLADSEVIYLLKGLFKVDSNGKPIKNSLGFNEREDFRSTWNLVSKSIGGIQDRQKAFDILKEEAELFPALKQLVDYKLPGPEGIKNTYAFDISSSFWHTFARPSAKFWQVSVIEGEPVLQESSPAAAKVLTNFKSYFKSFPNPYVKDQTLNLEKLVKSFSNNNGEINSKDFKSFLNALGIILDNTKKINTAIDNSDVQINKLFDLVKDIETISQKETLSKNEKILVSRFTQDPITTLQTLEWSKFMYLLPSFKTVQILAPVSTINLFANLQSKYGFDSPVENIILPDGNKAFAVTNHSSVSSMVDGINNLDELDDAWADTNSYMSFLDPSKNFFTNRSKLIASIFDPVTGKKIKGRELNFLAFAGLEVVDEMVAQGINTPDLVPIDKFYLAYNAMMQKGIGEFIRHAEKRMAFGVAPNEKSQVILDNGLKSGTDGLWISKDLFQNELEVSEGELMAIEGYLLDYIGVEFDRISFFKKNPEVLKNTIGFNRDVRGTKAGLTFGLTDDLLTKDIKKTLTGLAETLDENEDIVEYIKADSKLYDEISKSITNYFNQVAEETYKNYVSKIKSIPQDMVSVKAFVYNDYINKFEMFNLIHGDAVQFNHSKEQATKRAPGSTSNGDSFVYDEYAQDFINQVFQGENVNTYAKELSKELDDETIQDFNFDGTLNTGVIKDPKRKTVYMDELVEGWTEAYEKAGLTPQEIKYRLEKDRDPYEGIEEADGAAFATLDAYRMLKKLGGPNEWTSEQENLYQQVIKGEETDPLKVKEAFPVYKLHYYGPLMNSEINTTLMYKFAVAPIIPTIAKSDTELYKLQKYMIENNFQMITMSTGSKVSTLTMNGEFDDIYLPSDNDYFKDKYINPNAKLANNKIHIRYLKNVTKVASKLKKTITKPTQERIMTISGLFKEGEINDKHREFYNEYKNAVDALTDAYEQEFLDEIGYEFKDGKYVGKLDNLIRVIRDELELKDVPVQLRAALDVDLNEQLSKDFSLHPEAGLVEKIVINRIAKALVRQKVKGEKDIQVPSTFYNGLWSSEYEQDPKIINDPKEIKKFLGSNNLPSYRRGDILKGKNGKILKDKDGYPLREKTKLAKIAVSINHGDFINLLNLEYKGKKIGTRQNLNKLIKDDKFLEEHGDKVRITGPRIPVDDLNLKDGFEVWHFLDASSANTVVVPTEIVAKEGSDFDVDALFLSFPTINKDGSFPIKVDFKKEYAKLKAENKSTKALIENQIGYAQNELIRTELNILTLADNYANLTKPNATYLISDEAEGFYKEYAQEFDPLANKNTTERYVSPTTVTNINYDVNKFAQLLGGAKPLGMLAKKKKQHVLYKYAGMAMPGQILIDDDVSYNYVPNFKFEYQKTSDGRISFSHENSVTNQDISTTFSHSFQGVLDRGNNPFPAYVNFTKDSLPVFNRMLESGIDKSIALALINQPIIKRFLNDLNETKGIVAVLNGQQSTKGEVLENILLGLSDNLRAIVYNAVDVANENRLDKILDSNEVSALDGKFSVKYLDGYTEQTEWKTYKTLKGLKTFIKKNSDNSYELVINESKLGNKTRVYQEKGLRFFAWSPNELADVLWKDSYGSNAPTVEELQNNISKLEPIASQKYLMDQAALLLYFLQIQNLSSDFEQFEIDFNPDTSILDTMASLDIYERNLNRLLKDPFSKLDTAGANRLMKESVLSSMNKYEIYKDIVIPLFPLRLNSRINFFLVNSLLDKKFKKRVTDVYGTRKEDVDRFISNFNNAIVDYIYQNTMSGMPDTVGLPQTIPNENPYNLPVESAELSYEKPVEFTDSKIKVDFKKIDAIFKTKRYLSNNKSSTSFAELGLDTFKQNEDPFTNKDSFVKYLIEKESLYNQYDVKDFKNKTEYEQFISKRALLNNFNHKYIMGRTKYSYTQDVVKMIQSNKLLMERYPVLKQLNSSFFMKGVGYNLLELRDKGIIDSSTSNLYSKQLTQLGDVTVKKVKDKAKNKEISDIFKNFFLITLYQHGIGRGIINFPQIQNPETFMEIMSNTTNSFLNKTLESKGSGEIFNFITNRLLAPNVYKNYVQSANAFNGTNIETDSIPTEDSQLQKLEEDITLIEFGISIGAATEAELNAARERLNKYLDQNKPKRPNNLNVKKGSGVKIISEPYGVAVIETNPTKTLQSKFLDLIKPQIKAQAIKENKGRNANLMFQFGLRWARVELSAQPLEINSPSYDSNARKKEIAALEKSNKDKTDKFVYAYHQLDQNGTLLPELSELQPIIDDIQKSLGIDMSNYDAMIGNIYLPGQAVATHKDVTESKSAENYPVIVYTLGAGNAINIYENVKDPGKASFASDKKVTIPTKAGTIYTFGLEGKGRFELAHDTPRAIQKGEALEPITLPDGKVVKDYTITLTFRRAADLDPGMPKTPKSLISTPTEEVEEVDIQPIDISSNSRGLGGALTNPTELSKSKGNIAMSYPVEVRGKKYQDAEAAYQALKDKKESTTKPSKDKSSNFALMTEILTNKLDTYPNLFSEIQNRGGLAFLNVSVHQPTNKNTVWESGGQNWFIESLAEAFVATQATYNLQSIQGSLFIDPSISNYYNSLSKKEKEDLELRYGNEQFAQAEWDSAPASFTMEQFIEMLKCK